MAQASGTIVQDVGTSRRHWPVPNSRIVKIRPFPTQIKTLRKCQCLARPTV